MKTISQTILGTLIILLVIIFTPSISAQDISDFRYLTASGKVDVELIPGDEYNLEIIKDHEDLKIKQDGRDLKVKLDNIGSWFKDDAKAIVRITYESIREIRALAGARVSHEGICRSTELEVRAGSGGYMSIEVAVDDVKARCGEGAVIKISGNTEYFIGDASAGGHLKAMDLKSNHTKIEATTGGVATVMAINSIEARATTGGSITYMGNPEKFQVNESLGGSVRGGGHEN